MAAAKKLAKTPHPKVDYKQKVLKSLTDIQKKIILLASADEIPIRGRTWLQKEIFLISQLVDGIREEASFEPYMMGPYSDIVEEELTQLEYMGVVSVDDNKIVLTFSGMDIAKELKTKEAAEVLNHIKNFKEFLNDMTQDELLCYIHLAHPDMIVESVKYDKIKLKAEHILLNLVQKEKLSIGRAAELLRRDIGYVMHKLKQRGHQIFS